MSEFDESPYDELDIRQANADTLRALGRIELTVTGLALMGVTIGALQEWAHITPSVGNWEVVVGSGLVACASTKAAYRHFRQAAGLYPERWRGL